MDSPVITLENVTKRFRNEISEQKYFCAVDNVSLQIAQGSLTVVGGANGSGKSVLMHLIAGLMKPSSGKIFTKTVPGLIFQEASTQILGETPAEDVAVGPKNLRIPKEQLGSLVENSLRTVSLWHKAEFPAEFLSGGEKRRLAVAAILAMNKDILIFDEPYANLDFPGVKDVNKLILELKKSGKTVIILTHELEKCLSMSEHFIILQDGKIVFDGEPQEALTKNLEAWGIKNPLAAYNSLEDLVWL